MTRTTAFVLCLAMSLASSQAKEFSITEYGATANDKSDDTTAIEKTLAACGEAVEYHIAYGPGKIVDGKLAIADIPHRAKFPMMLKIVAYQFGSGIQPHVQTAEPVEQTVQVESP